MLSPRALPRATLTAALVVLAWLAGLGAGHRPTVPVDLGTAGNEPLADAPVAAVSWPPSAGLLVSEVVTRAANASDQYVELYNAAPVALSLADLELVYVTASGATVTRKQSWTDLSLGPGSHLLLANAAGSFAGQDDGLFSGGFSTSGGSLVLRIIGGGVIDSLSWGSAASAFVEGTPGAAPPTGSSLERLPGAGQGNATDTNDNLVDTELQPQPVAQNLAAPPVPAMPVPTPAATPTAPPSEQVSPSPPASTPPPYEGEPPFEDDEPPDVTPTPATTTTPTPDLTATPTPGPTATNIETPTPTPSPSPSPIPSPAPAPTPTATPTGDATPTAPGTPSTAPEPGPAPPTIAEVRSAPLGSVVTVHGVLTTPLGLAESGKGAFVQDDSAGIALYLADGSWPAAPAGTAITATGVLETRFSLLTVRLGAAADIQLGDGAALPTPRPVGLGGVAESLEGSLVVVEGSVTENPTSLSDGFSTAIGDGTSTLRIVVAAAADIDPPTLAKGLTVRLTGVVGQRDTSGTGLAGYRLHPRSQSDVIVLAMPTATPTTAPAPTVRPTASATPRSSPTATAAPTTISIAAALRQTGEAVTVEGVVTSPVALLDADGRRVTLQDGGAAILLRLPLGSAAPAVGQRLRVTGEVGTYYGAPQLAAFDAPQRLGRGAGQTVAITRAPIVADLEWRLVSVTGVVESVQRSGDAWRAELAVANGLVPVVGLGRSGIAVDALVAGYRATVIGVVRRAYPTAVDQRFAVVPRSPADMRLGAVVGAGTSPTLAASTAASASTGPGASLAATGAAGSAAIYGLAELAGHEDSRLRVAGQIVLIDGSRLVIRDETGSATLELVGDATALAPVLEVGMVVNASGVIGRDQRGGLRLVISRRSDIIHTAALPIAPAGGQPLAGATPAPTAQQPPSTSDPTEQAPGTAPTDPAGLLAALGALAVVGLVTGSAGLIIGRASRFAAARAALRTATRTRLGRLATLIRP